MANVAKTNPKKRLPVSPRKIVAGEKLNRRNPSNDPANANFNFYNYAAGNLSPEADLVHQCMLAWENGNPKGQIRAVLNVIFKSDLFRSHGGSMQKIKTPLEYTVSAVRSRF